MIKFKALRGDVNEALAGLRGKDGKTYKVDVMKSGKNIEFKITNQFGDFKTINLKQAAKLFEAADLETLDEAVALDEAFLRIPGEMINGELPLAIRDLESILKGLKAGNDFDAKGFNKQMARLTAVKKAAKKFNSEDEVPTRYNYTKK